LMRSKLETEKEKAAIKKWSFLMFLIEKKASSAINSEEFELLKNKWRKFFFLIDANYFIIDMYNIYY
jgi:hypothetical protein